MRVAGQTFTHVCCAVLVLSICIHAVNGSKAWMHRAGFRTRLASRAVPVPENVTGTEETSDPLALVRPTNTQINPNDAPPGPVGPVPIGQAYANVDSAVSHVFATNYSQAASLMFHYVFNKITKDKGIPTFLGNKIIFEVPKPFNATNTLQSITIYHRKDDDDSKAMKSIVKVEPDHKDPYKWDYDPCYHTVHCRNAKDGKWREWKGQRWFSRVGEPRAVHDPLLDSRIYGEPRKKGDPASDVLDDVPRWMGMCVCDLIMVTNVGGRCKLHGIRADYYPFPYSEIDHRSDQLQIFTESTRFAELPERRFNSFGGGRDPDAEFLKASKGQIYPDAIPIFRNDTDNRNINPWLSVVGGGLVIRLAAGQAFARCEVAVGDSKLDAKNNVVLGNSKLSAYIRPVSEEYQIDMESDWDVPNAGVFYVGAPHQGFDVPTSTEYKFGSAIIRIDALHDVTWVMGVRCQYYKHSRVWKTLPPSSPTSFH